MTSTTKLGLQLLANAAGNQMQANTTFATLNQLVQAVAVSRLATPPGSPADEEMYIVIATATGAWSGQEGKLAYWLTSAGAWQFITPKNGWEVRSVADAAVYLYNGSGWITAASAGIVFAPTVDESTTARTLTTADAGAYVRHTNAGASTVTVAPQASQSWATDTEIHIRRAGAGNLTLTPGAGVTLIAPSGGTLVMTEAMSVTLKRVSSDVWDVIGQTVAV